MFMVFAVTLKLFVEMAPASVAVPEVPVLRIKPTEPDELLVKEPLKISGAPAAEVPLLVVSRVIVDALVFKIAGPLNVIAAPAD